MHGHWESTTRKLNKHYQSSRKSGGILPPDDYIYGDFYMAGSLVSTRYIHNEYITSPYYYNSCGTQDPVISTNLVKCFHIRGLHKKSASAYKAFFVNTDPFDPSIQPEAYQAYMAEINTGRVGKCISNSNSLWRESGGRYFRYSLPTEAEATPYNVGVVEEGFYQLIKWKRETVPVMIDFSLSSIQEGETQFGVGQLFSFEQVDANDIQIYTGGTSLANSRIYTQQGQGKAYADGDQTILVKEGNVSSGRLVAKIGRVYCFLKNRSLYIDMKVHIINPDTGVDETEMFNCYLTDLSYPSPLYAICTAGMYRQPTSEYYPTYPSPAQGGYDYSTFALDTLHYGAQYWHYYTMSGGQMIYQPMATTDYPLSFMTHSISEAEFLAAKGGLT